MTGAVGELALVTLIAAVFGATLLVAPAALVRAVDYYPAERTQPSRALSVHRQQLDVTLAVRQWRAALDAGEGWCGGEEEEREGERGGGEEEGAALQASTAVRTHVWWRAFYFGPYAAVGGASLRRQPAAGYAPEGGEPGPREHKTTWWVRRGSEHGRRHCQL